MSQGKLIALYGINNLGKTTQAKRLVDTLAAKGHRASYLKYGLYDLVPSGPFLNDYLREGNPDQLSPREFQIIHVLNRTQFDAELRRRLEEGEWVVVEDYVGTGLAWGIGSGVDREFLKKINSHLIAPDVALLFTGERFLQGREENHRHESDDELMHEVALVHEQLGTEYGWLPINANQSEDVVADDVWRTVSTALSC